MAWLTSFFAPFVSHASIAALGTFLVASPIAIHLINRMRYRRVRFAAMEFLLASQQRNRRRLLLEQLILLLLRILIVLGLAALIARLTLTPSQLSLFGGAKAHHVVLLDDSGSTQDRWGETTAWKEALTVVDKLAKDGASRPNTQRFSLILLSKPAQPVFTQEDVNTDFVARLTTKLESLQSQAKFRSLDMVPGLDAARELLTSESAASKSLHVVSDFRHRDWVGQQSIAPAVKALDDAGIAVNLVRTVPERHGNLAIVGLSGDVHVAALNVPVRLKLSVRNDGEVVAKDVRVAIHLDGQKLTQTIQFDKIDPGKDAEREFDVVIDKPEKHVVQVSLEADSLAGDNARWLAIDVPPKNSVLIVDGDPSQNAGFFVASGLAANPELTGFSPIVETPEYLRRQPLHPFQCIYLVNVSEIAADGLEPLKDYVRNGGGVAWFVGPLVRPAFYNESLYEEGKGLFPLPLASTSRDLPPNDGTVPGADIKAAAHPIFERDLGQDNPFINTVIVSTYFPPLDTWVRDDNERKDGVQTIATLRNRQPLVLEHRYGQGRIVTCLTTADDSWSNWPKSPSFPLTMLEMEKHIARRDRIPEVRTVGQSIDFALDPVEFVGEVEIRSPKLADVPVKLTATRRDAKPAGDEGDGAPPDTTKPDAAGGGEAKPDAAKPAADGAKPAVGDGRLIETFAETDEPGIYTVSLLKQDDTKETRLFVYNVPAEEGELQLATPEEIRERLGPDVKFEIQEAGKLQWIQGRETGTDTRTHLLAVLAVLLLCEQLMAYRLSYHPKAALA